MSAPRLGLLVLLACLAGTIPFLAHPWFDAKNDASIYLVTADALRAGEGYSYLGEPFTIRPPAFSAFLALFVEAFGRDFRALNLMEHAFGALAVLLLYLLVRPRLGVPLAVAACIAVWLAPGMRALCNQVFSDVPGLAAVLACLLLERRAQRSEGLGLDVVLGLAIGLSALLRTVSVFLAPAVVGARLASHVARERRAPPRAFWARSAAILLAPALVLAPWFARNARVETAGATDQTHIHSYVTAMLHEDAGDPGSERITWASFRERLGEQALEVFSSLRMSARSPRDAARPADLALGVLLAAGLAVTLVRRREAPELYALLVLGVLLCYFAFMPRLVLPLFALALPAAADAIVFAAGRFFPAAAARLVAGAALLAFAATDFDLRPSWSTIREQHESLMEICAFLGETVPAGVPIGAPQGWHFSAVLGRDVYSLQPAMMRDDLAGGIEVIEKYGIGVYVFNPPKPVHAWMWQRLRTEFRIRRIVGDWAIVDTKPWMDEREE